MIVLSEWLQQGSSEYHVVLIVLWLANFVVSLAGLFCSIYLIIMHDDLTQRMIQPVELANALNRFCPLEYASSVAGLLLTAVTDAPACIRFSSVPLVLFNIVRIRERDYKLYFITKGEYKKFGQIERQYQLKTLYYTILFVMSLVMLILVAIDYFEL